MTVIADTRLVPTGRAERTDSDVPLPLKPDLKGADLVFRVILVMSAAVSLVVLGLIVVFLCMQSWDSLHHTGLQVVTSDHWAPPLHYGVLGDLVGSVAIALLALIIAVPVSIATALMINEYAPRKLRPALTGLVDLLATIPSIVYGFWGLTALNHYVYGTTKWLNFHGSFIPFLQTPEPGTYGNSIFLCGLVVGVMVIPIVTSISREVMVRAPREACEGALGLGGTRWGVVTDVILPFSRNGIVGAALLGMGRAIGETFAVYLILSSRNVVTPKILGPGGLGSISQLITLFFESVPKLSKSALTFAALLLFLTTLSINLIARVIIGRAEAAGV